MRKRLGRQGVLDWIEALRSGRIGVVNGVPARPWDD